MKKNPSRIGATDLSAIVKYLGGPRALQAAIEETWNAGHYVHILSFSEAARLIEQGELLQNDLCCIDIRPIKRMESQCG